MEPQAYMKRMGYFFDSFIKTQEEKEKTLKNVIIEHEKKYRNNLNSFFEILNYKTEVFKQIKSESDKRLSSDFSTFHFINTDELMLSQLLALCLDPSGNHGQGANFLIELFKILKIEVEIPQSKKKVRVLREYPTDNGRFIDIVIEVDSNAIVGIENKPFVEEMHNQVGDYITFLESKVNDQHFEEYYFIFLHKTGNRPVSIDIEKRNRLEEEGNLHTLSYHTNMKNIITKFYQICESDRFRYFLQDYIGYINDTFQGGDSG